MSKKKIHRSRMQDYSRREGVLRYQDYLNRVAEYVNLQLERDERLAEEEKQHEIDMIVASRKKKMSKLDKMYLDSLQDLLKDAIAIKNRIEATPDIDDLDSFTKELYKNTLNRLNTLSKTYEDTLNRFDQYTLYKNGYSNAANAYNMMLRAFYRPTDSSQQQEDTNYRQSVTPNSPLVTLNAAGILADMPDSTINRNLPEVVITPQHLQTEALNTYSPDSFLISGEQQHMLEHQLPEITITGDKDKQNKVALRNQLTKQVLDNYTRVLAEQQYNLEHNIPNKPDGYGSGLGKLFSSRWWNDATGTYLTRLNDTQSENFLGRIAVAKERMERLQNAIKYLDAIDTDNMYKRMLSEGLNMSDYQKHDHYEAAKTIGSFKKDYDYIQSLVSGHGILYLGDVGDFLGSIVNKYAGVGLDNGAEWFDWNDINRANLRGFDSKNRAERYAVLKKFTDKTNEYIEEWTAGYNTNKRESEQAAKKYNISDWYKYKEGTVSDDFFDLDSWMYKQAGLWGASQSSGLKSWTATGLNLLASGTSGLVKKLATAGVTLPMSTSASSEENYAEAAEAYKKRLEALLKATGLYDSFIEEASEKLGTSDKEEIFNKFILGLFIPTDKRQQEVAALSSYGLGALYLTDMMATTFDDVVSTAFELTPLGFASKETKMGRVTSFVKGGTAFGPSAMVAALGGGLAFDKIAKSSIGKSLSKRASGLVQYAKIIPDKLLGKKAGLALRDLFGKKSLPHKMFKGTEEYMKYQTIKEIGKDLLIRATVSSVSEGIEEGKQYLNSLKFLTGGFDDSEYMGLLSMLRIMDDTYGLAKSASVILGFPFFLNTTSDNELIANIKGGMKGGFTQTGATSAILAIPAAYKQLKWDEFVAQNALLDKAAMRDFWNKGILYSLKARGGQDVEQFIASFDHLLNTIEPRIENKDDLDAAKNLINQQKDMARSIFRLANSRYAKDTAEKQGIDVNSELYDQYVSLLSLIDTLSEEAVDKLQKQNAIVLNLITKLESPFTVENGTNRVIDQRIRKHTNDVLLSYVDPETKGGKEITGTELAGIADSRFRALTSIGANLVALKQIKAELEAAKNNNLPFKQSKRDIQFLLDRVNWEIKLNLNVFYENKREDILKTADRLIDDIDNKDELVNATRLNLMYQFEVDYFDAMTGGITGQFAKPEDEKADKNLPYSQFNAKDIIDDILKSQEEDYLLSLRIEQDWQNISLNRAEYTEQLKQNRLKEAERKRKENEKKKLQNTPKEESPTTERNENGKLRKKSQSLKDKKLKNKTLREQNKKQKLKKLKLQLTQQPLPSNSSLNGQSLSLPLEEQPVKVTPQRQKEIIDKFLSTSKESSSSIPDVHNDYLAYQEEEQKKKLPERGVFANAKDRKEFELLAKDFHRAFNSQLSSGLNGNLLAIGVKMAYLLLKGGVVHIAEFATEMVSAAGDAVRPYLKTLYIEAKRMLESEGFDTSNTDSIETVLQFDENNFDKPQTKTPNVNPPTVPTGEPGDNQAAADEKFSSALQSIAWKKLLELSIANDEKVDVNLRTSHDYFINLDGTLVMYPRVHSFIDSQYTPNPEELEHQRKVISELREAYNKGIDKFKEVANKYAKEFNEEFSDYHGFEEVDFSTYFQYVQDNSLELEDVLDSMATMVSRIPGDVSVAIGTVVDQICRKFFSGQVVNYQDVEGIELYITKGAFDYLISELTDIKAHYDSLGWKLFADPVKLYMTFYDSKTNQVRRIAGETDMIAVDKDGHYHIIDFKTSVWSYADKIDRRTGDINNSLDSKKPRALNDSRPLNITTREFYTNQQTMYSIMLDSFFSGSIVDSIELLPFQVKYEGQRIDVQTSLGFSKKVVGFSPVHTIENKAPKINDQREYIKEDGNIKLFVLRVGLNKSNLLQDRVLTEQDVKAFEAIRDSFKITIEEYMQQLDPIDRMRVSKPTIDAIRDLIIEYQNMLNVQPQLILDWETVIRTAERLSDTSTILMLQVQSEIDTAIAQEAQNANREQIEEFLRQQEAAFKKDVVDTLKAVDNLYLSEIHNLHSIMSRLLYVEKVQSQDQVSDEDIQKINQLVRNIDTMIYRFAGLAEKHKDQTKLYKSLTNWFFNTLNLPKVQVLSQLINSDIINESSAEWQNITTTWKQSLDGSVGIENAIAQDGTTLLSVTANPDFITNSKFELRIIPVNINGRLQNRLHVIVHYKGKTFLPVSLSTSRINNSLWNLVLYLQRAYPNKKILIDSSAVSRSNGRMIFGNLGTLLSKGLVKDLFNVEYSSDQHTFGITRWRKNIDTGLNELVVIVPGMDGGIKQELYNYGPDTDMKAGTLVMIVNPIQNENTDSLNKPRVPVILESTKLTPGDALLIIDILRMKYVNTEGEQFSRSMLDKEFCEIQSALIKHKGFTCKQVLSMFIPYGGRSSQNMRVLHLAYDSLNANIVHVYGYVEGEEYIYNDDKSIKDLDHAFNISTEEGREEFKNWLCENVKINIDERLIAPHIASGVSIQHPFNGILKILDYENYDPVLNKGLEITFGNSRLKIVKSDLKNPNNPSDLKGLSGLAFFMKLGFILTRFDGFENTLLTFDDNAQLQAVDNINQVQQQPMPDSMQALKQAEKAFKPEDALSQLLYDTEDNIDFSTEFRNKVQIGEAKQKLDSREKVIKHLKRIFGKQGVPVDIVSNVLQIVRQNAAVVGRCYADGIRLSEMAARGTEYHEAFHRISDILLSDFQRKKLYDLYRTTKKLASSVTEDEISEMMADDFMYYMSEAPKFSVYSFLHPFKLIKDFANWCRHTGGFKLFWFYTQAGVLGRFKNTKADEEAVKKFAKLYPQGKNKQTEGYFGEGHIIHGVRFRNIINGHMYRILRKTLVRAVLDGQDIDYAGRNIQNLSLDKDKVLNSNVIKWALNPSSKVPENTVSALRELLDNWDVVEEDIANDISMISTDYMKRFEDENVEDAESLEDAEYANIEQHIKASYQFSQFHRTSSLVRFFFARIPNSKLVTVDGELQSYAKLNELGLPEYMDVKFVFNTVLNKLHSIHSKSEMLEQIQKLAQTDAMFFDINKVIQQLAKNAKNNEDDQQLLTQIYNIIKSCKNEFEIAKSLKVGDGEWSVVILATDSEYSSINYRREWSKMFANGGTLFTDVNKDGRIIMNPKYTPQIFTLMASQMKQIAYIFSPESELPNAQARLFKGKVIDIRNKNEIEEVKTSLIRMLNLLGIQFDISMLDYMLLMKYKSTGYHAMKKLLHENFGGENQSVSSYQSFYQLIAALNDNGKFAIGDNNMFWFNNKQIDAKLIFESTGASFLSELSTYKYNYRHQNDLLSVLATNENRYYVIAENNIMSDITDNLNRQMTSYSEDVEFGMDYDYNIFLPNGEDVVTSNDPAYGSLIYKTVRNARNGLIAREPIRMITLAGFKTDEVGDSGYDYLKMSEREDYVAKAAILCDGGLVFPTMSDKKTWVYLRGLKLPGLNYKSNMQNLNTLGRDGILIQNSDVVKQIWEYAMCERRAIQSCINNVTGYVDENGVEHAPMTKEEKVDNYYGRTVTLNKKKPNEKKINVVLGARFTSLLGVYDENGKYIEFNRVLDENGNELNEEQNLKIADEYFFSAQEITDPITGQKRMETALEMRDRQFRQIQEVLHHQLIDELEYLEKLGLIKKNPNLKGRSSIELYSNIGLDSNKIKSIAKQLAENDSVTLDENEEYKYQMYMAKAISVFVNDVMVKSIMSIEEVERVYSGHPAFFKFEYDDNGHLIDRTTDQHKRFGGLVSTGQNNDLELGLPEYYGQAEIDDEEIGSDYIESIRKLMLEGELRSTYLRHMLNTNDVTMEDEELAKRYAEVADNIPLEQIQSNIPEVSYDIAVKLATENASVFEKGIDTVDGAAYMSDVMCENLLRMSGSWNSRVAKAFELLRRPDVSSITSIQEAYNLVWTTVIGAQKYTAYGFRHQKGVQVPYYNKMALFPLFKCICTGKMANIYDKMKTENIDVLCMKGAVKAGGQGSLNLDWANYRVDDDENNPENYIAGVVENGKLKKSFITDFHFNRYEQKYAYLRKQFNTDPKESEELKMGTQMTKVALSAIMPGREYEIKGGLKLSAKAIRDEIMACINRMSNIGAETIHKEFFNGDEFDIEKFSKILTEELTDRGAPQEMIDAVSIVKDKNGVPHFKVPLAAMSNLNFIESILVSRVNKKIVDINTPGAAFIQRSVFGLQGSTRVMGDKNVPKSLYNGRKLLMVNEEGSMDCVVSIDFFDDIIPKKNGKRMSFDEAKQWLINNGIMSGVKTGETEWSNAHANIVAYRIPTQAISSIHALRIVDVIPAVRDTVILPEEFTVITGSDFDIDKLYMSRKNFHFVSEAFDETTGFDYSSEDVLGEEFTYGKTRGKRHLTDVYPTNTLEYNQNRLIDCYISLLTDTYEDKNGVKTTRSMHMLHASIDNHTEFLKKIVKDLEEGSAKDTLTPYSAYTLSKQCSTKSKFITGKTGIGPFALNNNNHILTMLYNVSFANKEDSILTRLGLNKLDNAEDLDGQSILAQISGLINAHVDVAKDPYISRLNVNGYTYNLVNLLVRTGFGKRAFWFTTQPIMKALAETYNNTQGSYMSDSNVSKYRRSKMAEEAVIVNFAKANGYDDVTDMQDAIKKWAENVKQYGISVNNLVDWLMIDGAETMHRIAKEYNATGSDLSSTKKYKININDHTAEVSFFDLQIAIFTAKNQFDPYAQALADLVKYTKIDTKRHGKNIVELKLYKKGYDRLFDSKSKSPARKLFDTRSLDRLVNLSFIANKTEKALSSYQQILGGALIQGTHQFGDQIDRMMTRTSNDDYGNAKTIRAISNTILAKLKSKWFNKYAEDHNIDLKGLVDGYNTIYDRLGKLKVLIAGDPKYAHLRGQDGEVKNYLLRTLILNYDSDISTHRNLNMGVGTLEDSYRHVKFISTFSFIDSESVNADDITEAWQELLDDSALPDVLEFARDLILYTFITSSDNGGQYDLFKFVPNRWKNNPDNLDLGDSFYSDNSYSAYMLNLLEGYKESTELLADSEIEDIILNNWYDNTFVKVDYLVYNSETRFTPIYAGNINVKEEILIPGQGAITEYVPTRILHPSFLCAIKLKEGAWDATYNYETAPSFIKIARNTCKDSESQRRYTLYLKIGEGVKFNIIVDRDGKEHKEPVYYPIYAQVDPRGNKFRKNNVIYSYGRRDGKSEAIFSATANDLLEYKIRQMIKDNPGRIFNLQDVINDLVEGFNKIPTTQREKLYSNYGEISNIVEDLRARKYPGELDEEDIEAWSKLEGWSTEYFKNKVYKNIGEAWQIEYELADDQSVEPQYYLNMFYGYNGNQRDDVSSQTTFDAILNGERTATTRYEHNGLDKINYLRRIGVGDVIQMSDENGRTVKVVCTSVALRLSDKFGVDRITLPETLDAEQPAVNNTEGLYINHSGGALGSDTYWGQIGQQYEVKSNHYYYGQRTPNGNFEISQQDYEEGRYKAAEAAKYNYGYQYQTMKDERLIRNWAQVKHADAIFAIGHLVKPGLKLFPNQKDDTRVALNVTVQGGTGYAVAMAILDNKPVYVYDQERKQWYKNINGKWSKSEVPMLTKNFAGIGTRQLNEDGKKAIEEVYKNTFTPQSTQQVQQQVPASSENTQQQSLPGSETKMNIWWGKGENDPNRQNADLSNFAKRPFKLTQKLKNELEEAVGFTVFGDDIYSDTVVYNSVELAFQDAKIAFAYDGTQDAIDDATADRISKSIRKANSVEAKRLGRTIPMSKLAIENWDKKSSKVMKILLRESFLQNPQALQKLLATGNATLTHTQDKGKWGTEFPKLLMEVREELRKESSNDAASTTDNSNKVFTSSEAYKELEKYANDGDGVHARLIKFFIDNFKNDIITYIPRMDSGMFKVPYGEILFPRYEWGKEDGESAYIENRKIALHELIHSITSHLLLGYYVVKDSKWEKEFRDLGYKGTIPTLSKAQINAFDKLLEIKKKVSKYFNEHPEEIFNRNNPFGSNTYYRAFEEKYDGMELDEFISEAFSNPTLQAVMAKIPSSENSKKTIFDIVLELLGKIFNVKGTLFEDFINAANDALSARYVGTQHQVLQQPSTDYVVTNEGIRIPMEKGTTIKLPKSLGGTTITIERIYEDPYEGTKFYGTQYDSRGNRISDITEVITFYNETNGIQVFDAQGRDITNDNGESSDVNKYLNDLQQLLSSTEDDMEKMKIAGKIQEIKCKHGIL